MSNLFRLCFCFNVITVFSLIFGLFLFFVYKYTKPNPLLKSCCFFIIFSNFLILLGGLAYRYDFILNYDFCILQAIFLNYSLISIHAHLACLMINNFLIINKLISNNQGLSNNWVCIISCFLFAIFPTIAIIMSIYLNSEVFIYPKTFFCSIMDPFGIVTFWWIFLFSMPGVFCSFYLLFKILKSRNTISNKARSQFNNFDIFRLSLSVVLYLLISLISIYPSSTEPPFVTRAVFPVPAELKSPWRNYENVCSSVTATDSSYIKFYKRLFCLNLSTYILPFLGLLLFIMYGLSNAARQTYVEKICKPLFASKNPDAVNEKEEIFEKFDTLSHKISNRRKSAPTFLSKNI